MSEATTWSIAILSLLGIAAMAISSFRPITKSEPEPRRSAPVPKQRNLLPAPMKFGSHDAFFEYQCAFGDTVVRARHPIVAHVIHAEMVKDTQSFSQQLQPDSWALSVIVASSDGGFHRETMTPGPGDPIREGDLVAWMPLMHHPVTGWNGLVIAKLAPELSDQGFKVLCYY